MEINEDGYTPKQMAKNIILKSLEGALNPYPIFNSDEINYAPYTFRDKTIKELEKIVNRLVKSLDTPYKSKQFMDISHYYDMKVKPPLMDWQIFYVWYNRSMNDFYYFIIFFLSIPFIIWIGLMPITKTKKGKKQMTKDERAYKIADRIFWILIENSAAKNIDYFIEPDPDNPQGTRNTERGQELFNELENYVRDNLWLTN